MTAARESRALGASLAIHLLVLVVLLLAREPGRQPPSVPVLRLTLPVLGGAAEPLPAPATTSTITTAADQTNGGTDSVAGNSAGGLPVTAAPPAQPVSPAVAAIDVPVVSRAADTGRTLLPHPRAALATALAALDDPRSVPPPQNAVPAAASGPDPATPVPRVTFTDLPAVERPITLPPYPAELSTHGIEADIVMELTVEDGTVTRAEVLQSSGLSSADAEYQLALRRYLFAAAAGVVTGTVHIQFRLERGF